VSDHIPWQNRPTFVILAIAVVLVVVALIFFSTRPDESAQVEGSDNVSIPGTVRSKSNDESLPLEPLVETDLSVVTVSATPGVNNNSLEVTIVVNGESTSLRTDARSVGEALDEAGIVVEADDAIEPNLTSALRPDQEIVVRRSIPLAIRVDGQVVFTRSHSLNVTDVLAEAGIILQGQDYAFPGPDHQLRPNDTIQVTRVTEELRFEDVPLPFETIWQAVDSMELDQRSLISAGAPGMLRRQYRLRREDGILISETFEGESIVQEPVNEVMGYGTKINIRVLESPEGSLEYWRVVRMRVTAYTAASSGKPPDHPTYGITASGLEAGTGIVAIDPKVVPFRSWVYVPGYGLGYAGDTGGSIKGRWIDLGYDEDELLAWSGYVDVFYLVPVPPPESINYLIPSALP
jgi:uncharacterized protein YabE (DUF348 family)